MAEPKQTIENINIKDLVLWTENPRDRVVVTATDQDIAKRIIEEGTRGKWRLKKLFESMGKRFDNSELPTVVPVKGKRGKYVVYDGNRRVLIGKIRYGFVDVDIDFDFENFDFPQKIPCNICDKQTALEHVDRKHGDNGTWDALERDIFKRYRMKEDKSVFLAIDEATGIISNNPFMNKRFVKDEVFSEKALDYLGVSVKDNRLITTYKDNSDFIEILNKAVALVYNKKITTRENRGELISLLEKDDNRIKDIISKNKNNKLDFYKGSKIPLRTPRTEPEETPLFGKDALYLKKGTINNLLLDLEKIHSEINKKKYTKNATMIVAMGLRLICQVADKKYKRDVKTYIDKYFDDAKKELTDPSYLITHNVRKKNMARLLNDGAHENADTISRDQTIALSLIIGKILKKTHGAETSK